MASDPCVCVGPGWLQVPRAHRRMVRDGGRLAPLHRGRPDQRRAREGGTRPPHPRERRHGRRSPVFGSGVSRLQSAHRQPRQARGRSTVPTRYTMGVVIATNGECIEMIYIRCVEGESPQLACSRCRGRWHGPVISHGTPVPDVLRKAVDHGMTHRIMSVEDQDLVTFAQGSAGAQAKIISRGGPEAKSQST